MPLLIISLLNRGLPSALDTRPKANAVPTAPAAPTPPAVPVAPAVVPPLNLCQANGAHLNPLDEGNLGKPMKRWLWNFSKAHHLKPKSSVRCGYLPPSFYRNRNPPQMPWVFSRLTIQAIANPPLVYPAISSATWLWEPWVGPYLKNPRGLPSFSD